MKAVLARLRARSLDWLGWCAQICVTLMITASIPVFVRDARLASKAGDSLKARSLYVQSAGYGGAALCLLGMQFYIWQSSRRLRRAQLRDLEQLHAGLMSSFNEAIRDARDADPERVKELVEQRRMLADAHRQFMQRL